MHLEEYQLLGGQHTDTAALKNVLANQGVTAPHTGAPYSEAMLLGVGGGLGMGYILWEFAEHNQRTLTMGMRKDWQYPVRFMDDLASRLGLELAIQETGGAQRARAQLDAALANGQPAVLWVDRATLPYMYMPDHQCGWFGFVVAVYGIDAQTDTVNLDDRALMPVSVDTATLAAARARIPSYKHRMLTVNGAGEVDLPRAVRAGLVDCAEHLHAPSQSFSLPAIRKWAKSMTDGKNAKGWPVVFADRHGLYGTLRALYESVVAGGPGGGSLRDLYAEFLQEAAPLVQLPGLLDVAKEYKWLGIRWSNLAELALPTHVPPLARTKDLLVRQSALFAGLGDLAADELQLIGMELAELSAQFATEFPLDDGEIDRLFQQLQAELYELYAAEVAANHALRTVLGLDT